VPKDSTRSHQAMRVVTDVVIPCGGSTWSCGGWPLFRDHGGISVVTYAIGDSKVSICGYGLLSPPRHDVASFGRTGIIEVCFCIMVLCFVISIDRIVYIFIWMLIISLVLF
jgi:hypothetical protein